MNCIQTYYCRDQWNDLTRISVGDNVIHFDLGYQLKGSSLIPHSMPSEDPPNTYFKWKYDVAIDNESINLKCVDVIDKEKHINKEEVKYNIWHTDKCKEMEERFPKFSKDLTQNFPKEEWIQIIIELFPSISSYPKRHCMLDVKDNIKDVEKYIFMFENKLAKDWIINKRKDNWDDQYI